VQLTDCAVRQRTKTVALEESAAIASEADDGDPLLQRRLRELVGALPPAPRAVIVLRYQEDLDPVEIARTLSMSINTVKSHLKRSLASLRDQVGPAAAIDPEVRALKLVSSATKNGSTT